MSTHREKNRQTDDRGLDQNNAPEALSAVYVQRRHLLRVAGGATLAALAGTSLVACAASNLPADAISAWQGPGPKPAGKADPRRWILAHAILAPHAHNLQSWLVDLGIPNSIVLYCDLQRLLPETDPFSRQIMISHGAFLELIDIAARECGLRADIDFFPQGTLSAESLDARPIAHIRLSPDANVRPDPLFAQIRQRHTDRGLYELGRPVSAQAWRDIEAHAMQAAGSGPAAAAAASSAGPALRTGYATLDASAPNTGVSLGALRSIASEAWRIELTTPRTIM